MKRRLVLLLLLLAGGAIVNVAVAWAPLLGGSWGELITAYNVTSDHSGSETYGSGWPMLSVQQFVQRGWHDQHLGGVWVSESAYLPLRPLWPGFAINTVFYAVIVWLLFAGPFVVRRWRRIRRGLCPKCAYDLRATQAAVCPECGATR